MERRVLLAILLSFVVLYGYQALLKPRPTVEPAGGAPPPAAAGAETTNPVFPPGGAGAGQGSQGSQGAPGSVNLANAPPTSQPIVGGEAERDIHVETADVIAVFTNRGGRLKSWRLKHYFDQNKEPQELIDLVPNQPLPFTLRTPDDSANVTINNVVYAVSGAPAGPAASAPVDLKFAYRDAGGLDVVKEFHIEPTLYALTFRAAVKQGPQILPAAILWGPAVGDAATGSSYSQKPQGLIAEEAKVQRLAAKDIAKQATYQGTFRYAGVDDNYFMTVAMPQAAIKVTYQPVTIPAPNPKDPARELMSYALEPSQPGEPVKFFVGPKDFDVLAKLGPDMTRAINFGIFSVIVVPLLRSLKWVNTYVGNYGWSIVVLTIIIQVMLFPLQHKSIVSMRKMQEIQPEMKAIQERYEKYKATDPEKQKMNQEMMALYRERGVNPASGCVPIILTMPLLLAMWSMLQTSIELRGAPFLWIHDLTVRDPYYISPVLMGLTQFWQQIITPAAGADPAQQKMMRFMPVIMTVMFITLPAGALVYYTVSNLLRIGQQYVTNSIIGPPKVRSARPPAERRVKRVGSSNAK
jgi:YidC/Oxa1 family membrane protein insertase